jgi:hypothetical protein
MPLAVLARDSGVTSGKRGVEESFRTEAMLMPVWPGIQTWEAETSILMKVSEKYLTLAEPQLGAAIYRPEPRAF